MDERSALNQLPAIMERATSILRFILSFAIPALCWQISNAQSDPLWREWNNTSLADSTRMKAIQQLAWKTVFQMPDSGMALADRLLQFAIEKDDAIAKYEAYTTKAVGSSLKSDHRMAIEYFQQCLLIARELKEPRREANTLSNMGNAYKNLGDLPMALQLLEKSRAIDEGQGNDAGLAGTYNNLGNIYTELKEHQRALEQYQKSADLYERTADRKGKAQASLNIGVTHWELGDRIKALEGLMVSRMLYTEMRRKLELGMVHNNLGRIRGELGEFPEALKELDLAEELLTEVGNKRSLARTHYYRGGIFLDRKEYRNAIEACRKGREIAVQSGSLLQQKECDECLLKAYGASGDYRNAFFAQQAFLAASDSIEKLNDAKEITRMEVTRVFQERQIADSLDRIRERYDRELRHNAQLASERDRRNMVLIGSGGLLLLAGGLYNRLRFVRRSRALIQKERDRSDDLLHNILPREVAAELKQNGSAKARQFDQVTILFSDFVGFTRVSELLTPAELVDELNDCFTSFDRIMETHSIEKIKTIGDAYMAAAGLTGDPRAAAVRMVLAALDIRDHIVQRRIEREAIGRPAFEMRIGIHTGAVVAGIVGSKKFAYDIWGDPVNVAARMESAGEKGKVNVSAVTFELIADVPALRLTPRGRIAAKGKGDLEMYFVDRA